MAVRSTSSGRISATLKWPHNGSTSARQRAVCDYCSRMPCRQPHRSLLILVLLLLSYEGADLFAEENATPRRVVVVVWDGMRRDMVSEKNTPTLWKLAQDGVTFRNHHSVYPSATNVNGTTMATGVY